MATKKKAAAAKKSANPKRKAVRPKSVTCKPDLPIDAEVVLGRKKRSTSTAVIKMSKGIDRSRLVDVAPPAKRGSKKKRAIIRRPQARAIVQDDDRVRVINTTRTPFAAICNLTMQFDGLGPNTLKAGTGWLAAPRLIITAGHNVRDHRFGDLEKVIISPGQDGVGSIWQTQTVRASDLGGECFRLVSDYVANIAFPDVRPDFDYAAIILPEPFEDIQPFDYDIYDETQLTLETFNVVGYPAETNEIPDSTMWRHSGQISRVTSRRLIYTMDTSGGQSGAPVFDKVEESGNVRYVVVGIHNAGNEGEQENYATRIGPSVYQRIQKWRKLSEEL